MRLSMANSPPQDAKQDAKPARRRSIRLSDAHLRGAVQRAAQRFLAHRDPQKPLVLTGIMGVGKTAVGRRLASVLQLAFVDSDDEIERAAGQSISEIFERYGERYFRDRERAVIARLLDTNQGIIAIGGGAFVDAQTRTLILERGIAVWLQAPLDLLVERTGRRGSRPLLRDTDPRQVLEDLLEQRSPAYAQAPVRANSGLGRVDRTVLNLLNRVNSDVHGIKRNRRPRRNRPRRSSPSRSKQLGPTSCTN